MNIFNMNEKKFFFHVFTSVTIWIVSILICGVFLQNCSRPQFFSVSMIDESLTSEIIERKGIVDWSQLHVDSLNIVHLAADIDSATYMALRGKIFREEIKVGRLMTAEQMSEKITGYYDKLIDVLIALFVVFSIASYFVINNKFKKQYEEDKAGFVEDIKQSLLDSQSLHDDLVNGISTKIEGRIITENDIQGLKAQMKKTIDNYALLAEAYDELSEQVASKQEIVDFDKNIEV